MKRNEAARLRLANQQLINPGFRTAAKLVDYFGTMQAPHMTQAKWALGSRLDGSHVKELDACFADNKICRTWLFRGTVSFVTPQDLPWMSDLVYPRMKALYDTRLDKVGMTAKDLLTSQDILFRALKQAKSLTQAELFDLLKEAGLDPSGERAYLFLVYAALEKVIVMGFGEGKATNYLLYDDVVGAPVQKSEEEALTELALRYFNSRGPAQLIDFAWWAGISPKDARLALELASPQLSVMELDGVQYFLSPMSKMPTEASVHLLPAFDEYIVAYKNRDIVLDPRRATDIDPKKNGLLLPTFEINGEIEGTWKLEATEEVIRIQNTPFRPLLEQEGEAIRQAGLRYLQFMTTKPPAKDADDSK